MFCPGWQKWHGMFCPGRQKWHGMFCPERQKLHGMFCPGWQIDAGFFVRGVKKWHGMFCPGMFCPTFHHGLLSQKYMVWPFDPTPWVEGVSVGKIFATMLLQKLSALIWYATWPYSEKFNFGLGPHPRIPPQGLGPMPSNYNTVWYVLYLLMLCLHAKFQQKILTIALVIAKFKYLTFDPLGRVKGGGVKLWHCHAYLQALGNQGV